MDLGGLELHSGNVNGNKALLGINGPFPFLNISLMDKHKQLCMGRVIIKRTETHAQMPKSPKCMLLYTERGKSKSIIGRGEK